MKALVQLTMAFPVLCLTLIGLFGLGWIIWRAAKRSPKCAVCERVFLEKWQRNEIVYCGRRIELCRDCLWKMD